MKTAIISGCGEYRYSLTRGENPKVLFVMLNPSTADAELDDPTIRRCAGFTKQFGYESFQVVNLYALRSTDPSGLWVHRDPVGPENDDHIFAAAICADLVICAWGTNAKPEREIAVAKIISDAGKKMFCLGGSKNGTPRHPLYFPYGKELIGWVCEVRNA